MRRLAAGSGINERESVCGVRRYLLPRTNEPVFLLDNMCLAEKHEIYVCRAGNKIVI